MITPSRFLFLSLLAFCFTSLTSGDASQLPEDEVQALKDIAKTLGKKDWNFSTNPCSGQPNWTTPIPSSAQRNNVSCDCSVPNDNFCHVVFINLAGQNLQGRLPPELIRLPYLQVIDFTRNYLSGTIPKEWGSMNLVKIYLTGNRLTGSIPAEIANISTLQTLTLWNNNFSGNLPPELGNLTRLENLLLVSNNFTGELPESFSRLTTLKNVQLGDNQFSGSIPNFIQRWTNLHILEIQGSGFSGPIPKGISSLQNLTHLMISDLNGLDSTFPSFKNMKSLKRLILRSCNINDTLPEYLGDLTTLNTLDLSYNKLRGRIPGTFERLREVDYIYLTGNLLTGPVPKWTETAKSIDLSYNNFSNENLEPKTCREQNMNLFASFVKRNDSGPLSCGKVKDTCPKTFYSFYINCGGTKVMIGGTTYDEDIETRPAISKKVGENWAFSSTGHILENSNEYQLIQINHSRLYVPHTEAELYMNARVSPISLTYYGLCLSNGNYTVKLHFAEIMFTDDNTFSSLGRRVFEWLKLATQFQKIKEIDSQKEQSLFLQEKSKLLAELASISHPEDFQKKLKEVVSQSEESDNESRAQSDSFNQNEDDCYGISLLSD